MNIENLGGILGVIPGGIMEGVSGKTGFTIKISRRIGRFSSEISPEAPFGIISEIL